MVVGAGSRGKINQSPRAATKVIAARSEITTIDCVGFIALDISG
jgi:hypothetical protein